MGDVGSRIRDELEQLRQEIASVALLPALSPEFTTWLVGLFAAVKSGFGTDSQELHQLREISPELPIEFFDSVADRLELLGLDGRTTAKFLTDLPHAIHRRRLYEYDELIAAMIFSLRSEGK